MPPVGGVDRCSGSERIMQRRSAFRFDCHHTHAARIPRGNPADEAAAPDGNEQRIESRRLFVSSSPTLPCPSSVS